jgi:hypothetical protein
MSRFFLDPRTARATWTILVILGARELLHCVSVGPGHGRRAAVGIVWRRLQAPEIPPKAGREAESSRR